MLIKVFLGYILFTKQVGGMGKVLSAKKKLNRVGKFFSIIDETRSSNNQRQGGKAEDYELQPLKGKNVEESANSSNKHSVKETTGKNKNLDFVPISEKYDIERGFQPIAGTSTSDPTYVPYSPDSSQKSNEDTQIFKFEEGCLLCRGEDTKFLDTCNECSPFIFRVPIKLFDNYDKKNDYILSITILPYYKIRKLLVQTNQIGNYVDVQIRSDWCTEYILDSNVALCFEIEVESSYIKKSDLFNFKRLGDTKSTLEEISSSLDQSREYFYTNTFAQSEGIPLPIGPKCEFNSTLQQYEIDHPLRGIFTLNTRSVNELRFYVYYMPFLFCSYNMKFFKDNQTTCLENTKYLSNDRRQLFISFYDSIFDTKKRSYQSKVVCISLHLYNILIDVLKNYEMYKDSSFFPMKIRSIEKEVENMANDEENLDIFLKNLKHFSTTNDFTSPRSPKYYFCLSIIFDCLFSYTKEQETEFGTEDTAVEKTQKNNMWKKVKNVFNKMIK